MADVNFNAFVEEDTDQYDENGIETAGESNPMPSPVGRPTTGAPYLNEYAPDLPEAKSVPGADAEETPQPWTDAERENFYDMKDRKARFVAEAMESEDPLRAALAKQASETYSVNHLQVLEEYDYVQRVVTREARRLALAPLPGTVEWFVNNPLEAPIFQNDLESLTAIEKGFDAMRRFRPDMTPNYYPELDSRRAVPVGYGGGYVGYTPADETTGDEALDQKIAGRKLPSEQLWGEGVAGFNVGANTVKQGMMWLDSMRSGEMLTIEQQKEDWRMDEYARAVQQATEDGFFYNAGMLLGTMAGSMTNAVNDISLGGAIGGGLLTIATGGTAAPAIIGSALMGTMAGSTFNVEAGLEYKQLIENGVRPDAARNIASTVGFANSMMEMIGLRILGKAAAPVISTIKEKFIKETAEAITVPTVRAALLQTAKSYVMGVGGESFTEGVQELSAILGDELGRIYGGGKNPQITEKELYDRLMGVTISTAKGASLLGLFGGATVFASQLSRVSASREHIAALETMVEATKNSEVLKNSPASILKYLSDRARETGSDTVYVRGSDLQQLMTQYGVTVEELQQAVSDIGDQLAKVIDNGGDVKIKLEDFVVKLGGTEFGAALMQTHARMNPEDMSVSEQIQYADELNQTMADLKAASEGDAEAEARIREGTDAPEVKTIYDEAKAKYLSELNAASASLGGQYASGKFAADEINRQAELGAAVVTRLGARLGLNPEQIEAIRPKIRTEGGAPKAGLKPAEKADEKAAETADQKWDKAQAAMSGDKPELFQTQSTVLPTPATINEGRSLDPRYNLLTLDFNEVLKRDDILTRIISGMENIAGMKAATKGATTDAQKAQMMIDWLKDNLRYVYDMMTPEQRERAKKWYVGGRKFVQKMRGTYKITDSQGAGVIAVLSPQRDWFSNLSLAERVCDMVFGTGRLVKVEGDVLANIDRYNDEKQKQIGKALNKHFRLDDEKKDVISALIAERDKSAEDVKKSVSPLDEQKTDEIKKRDDALKRSKDKSLSEEERAAALKEYEKHEKERKRLNDEINAIRKRYKEEDAKRKARIDYLRNMPLSVLRKRMEDAEARISELEAQIEAIKKEKTKRGDKEAKAARDARIAALKKDPAFAKRKAISTVREAEADWEAQVAVSERAKKFGTLEAAYLAGDYLACAMIFRAVDEKHNPRSFNVMTPDGSAGGQVMTESGKGPEKITMPPFGTLAKAFSILADGSDANINIQLGDMHKVRNFYNNLLDPMNPLFATIDTHAVAADTMTPTSAQHPYVKGNFSGAAAGEIGTKGTYVMHFEAYRQLADELGILPRELQSITWEGIRVIFTDKFKQDEKNVAKVNSIWKEVDEGKKTAAAARDEIFAFAMGDRKLKMAWEGTPDYGTVGQTYDRSKIVLDRTNDKYPRASFSMELAPNPDDAAAVAKWQGLGLTPDQMNILTMRVLEEVAPMVGDLLGVPISMPSFQLGGFGGQINPSVVITTMAPDKAPLIAKVFGWILKQKSVWVMSEDVNAKDLKKNHAVIIEAPPGFSAQQLAALYQKLYAIKDANGYSYLSGLSFGDDNIIFGLDDDSVDIGVDELVKQVADILDADPLDFVLHVAECSSGELSTVNSPEKELPNDSQNSEESGRVQEKTESKLLDLAAAVDAAIQRNIEQVKTARQENDLGKRPPVKDVQTVTPKPRLAPNGRPSNLPQHLYDYVRTPEFKAFFGDWENDPANASKIVDENGEPLVVYHGSDQIISDFNTTGFKDTKGTGAWFVDSEDHAKSYGQAVTAAFLNIREMDDVDAYGQSNDEIKRYRANTADGEKYFGDPEEAFSASVDEDFTTVTDDTNALARRARKDGADGIVIRNVLDIGQEVDFDTAFKMGPATDIVVFDGANVVTVDLVPPKQSGTLNQLTVPAKPLFTFHNISEQNLKKASDLGGLAVPSLGIGRVDFSPTDFGEITLIGTKGMVDPATGTPVWSIDAYTNRFPDLDWSRSYKKDAAEKLAKEAESVEGALPFGNSASSQIRNFQNFGWGMSELRSLIYSKPVFRYLFLKEKGISVEPVRKEVVELSDVDKKLKEEFDKVTPNVPSEMAEYSQAFSKVVEENADIASNAYKKLAKKIRDGEQISRFFLDVLKRRFDAAVQQTDPKKVFDEQKTAEAIAKAAAPYQDELNAWIEEKANGLMGEPMIKVGRSLKPLTLANVVEAMTKRSPRNTESDHISAGTIRAAAGTRFRSMKSIGKSRDKIADSKTVHLRDRDITFDMQDFFQAASQEAGAYVGKIILLDAVSGKPSREKLVASMKKHGLSNPSAELVDQGMAVIERVKEGITDYFEAKPQRAVMFSEFGGAVVPDNVSNETLQILKDNGIEVSLYKAWDNADRQSVVKQLAEKLQQTRDDVLFQIAYHGSPYKFDRFTLEHIGEGEGHQAHGYGLYFALDKSVALGYRSTLTNGYEGFTADNFYDNFTYDGMSLDDLKAKLKREMRDSDYEIDNDDKLSLLNEFEKMESVDDLNDFLGNLEREMSFFNEETQAWAIHNVLPAIYKRLSEHKEMTQGRVYEVSIPDNDVMIREEARFEDQPEIVKRAVYNIFTGRFRERLEEFANDRGFTEEQKERFIELATDVQSAAKRSKKADPYRVTLTNPDVQGKVDAVRSEFGDDAALFAGSLGTSLGMHEMPRGSGREILAAVERKFGNPRSAAQALNAEGVKGVRYYGYQDGECAVVWDEDAIQIREYLDQAKAEQQQSDVRGGYSLDDNSITLTKDADLSTVAHELSHWYMISLIKAYDMKGADITVRQDVDTLMKEFGIESVEKWNAMTLNEQRKYHERFAYWTEIYLATGKAPSKPLEGVFQRFGRWIRDVYRQWTGGTRQALGDTYRQAFGEDLPELSDEVRRVFDRMLASEEMLSQAESAENLKPLFDQKPADMSDDDWREMMRERDAAEAEGVDKLNAARAKDEKWYDKARSQELRRIQRQGKEVRDNTREKVKAELENEPIYKAIAALRQKGKESIKLDRDALKLIGVSDRTIAKLQVLGMTRVGTLDDERVRITKDLEKRVKDYKDSIRDETWKQVKENPSNAHLTAAEIRKKTEREIEKRVKADLGDIGTPATLRDAVDAAVKAEAAKRIEAVRNLIAPMMQFNSVQDMISALVNTKPLDEAIEEETTRRAVEEHGELFDDQKRDQLISDALRTESRARLIATELKYLMGATGIKARILREAARRVAADRLSEMKVKDVRPKAFEAAENRASRRAFKCLAKGDRQGAVQEKYNQLVQHEMARMANKVRKESERLKKITTKAFKSDKKLSKGYETDIIACLRFVLTNVGLGKRKKGEPVVAEECLKKVMAYDPEYAVGLKAILDKYPYKGDAFRPGDMSVTDFLGLCEDAQWLLKLSAGERALTLEGRKVEIDDAIDELLAQLQKTGAPQFAIGQKEAVTGKEERMLLLKTAKAYLTRVESWCIMMDGDNPAKPFQTYVFRPIANAAANYRVKNSEYQEKLMKLLKARIAEWEKCPPIDAKEIGYQFNRKAELIGALLHCGNASNKKKLLVGGRGEGRMWCDIAVNPDGSETVDYRRWDGMIARFMRDGIITKEDMDFCQAVWDLTESMKPMAQKAYKAYYGYYFEEIEATPLVTPFGIYRGGYVPAFTDPQLVAGRDKQLEQDMMQSSEFFDAMPVTKPGFAQSRVEYNKPLYLDAGLIGGHISKVLKFAMIAPAVKDVQAIISSHRFKTAIDGIDPKAVSQMLVPWLKRSATQTVSTPTTEFGRWVSKIRGVAAMNLMAMNISNALQQATGLTVAAVKVGHARIAVGMASMMADPKGTYRRVTEASVFMKGRLADHAIEYQSSIEKMAAAKAPSKAAEVKDWLQRHAYILQTGMQSVVDIPVWLAAYNQAIEAGRTEAEAVADADSVVRTTQSSFDPESVARVETGDPLYRALLVFYNYFNMQWNLLGERWALAKQKDECGTFALDAVMIAVIPAVLSEIIAQSFSGFDTGDDDDWDAVDALRMLTSATFRNAVAMIPFGGNVINVFGTNLAKSKIPVASDAAQFAFGMNPYNDRVVSVPITSLIENAAKATGSVFNAIEGDGKYRTAVRNMLDLLTLMTGMPFGMIKRPASYAADLAQGEAKPESALDVARGFISGKDVNAE